ncbi:MAG: ABC transporter permease subunit [Candidatus Thermoplasmatota archaeon]|nr:ABC transporter permease subunit [Candidatus Thermoplasmatota archaeon]
MNISFASVITIARKEFYEYLKTKRLLIVGGLYAIGFLLAVSIMSYYKSPDDFRSLISTAHSIVSIFYILLPITLSYDLIAGEWSRKSIFLLLSKSVNREEVIIGKFLGISIIICTVLIPVATIGHLIAIAALGNPGLESMGRAYAYLAVILLGTACYISFSLLFSTITRTTATALISSIIVGWFGLNMVYPIANLFRFLTGHGSDSTPLYGKIAFAISPSNCMAATTQILSDKIMGFSTGNIYPISIFQAVIMMAVFCIVIFIIALTLFKRKELT